MEGNLVVTVDKGSSIWKKEQLKLQIIHNQSILPWTRIFFFFFFLCKKQENNSLKANLEKFKEIYKKLAIKIAIRIIILENEKEIKQLSNIHIL